ncbi:MAG: chorismate-binding protein [Solirubrobacterales bacterium]
MHASTDRVTAPGPGPELRRRELRGPADPLSAITWLERDRLPVALAGTWSDNELVLTSEPVRIASAEEDPFDLLGSVGDAPHPGAAPGAIGGGWFGWLGFGLSRRLEELPHPPPRPRPWPDFHLALYDHVVRFDGRGWFFECLPTPAREAELDRLAALWERRLAGEPPAPEAYELGPVRPYGSGTASHRVAVEEAVERIKRGDLLQANVCMRLEGRIRGSLLSAWVRGVREARPAYAAFVGGADRSVASLSPELFLRSRDGVVASEPIKGTAPADTDPAALRASAKDRAENVMIVDLMRNDLGRVAEFGSVTVDELCEVRPAAGVWHLVSRVSARLREGATAADLLRATFPPGSVTGAPKIQALKLIAELEGTAREVYCGAIGLSSPLSGLELNVAIRTLEAAGEELSLGAGGGVVAESTGAGEVAEALTKARGVCRAVGAELIEAPATGGDVRGLRWIAERPDPELGILETIAVADGRCVISPITSRVSRRSAARLGLPLLTGLEEEIEAEATEIADGGLRIVCSRQGHEIGPRSRPGRHRSSWCRSPSPVASAARSGPTGAPSTRSPRREWRRSSSTSTEPCSRLGTRRSPSSGRDRCSSPRSTAASCPRSPARGSSRAPAASVSTSRRDRSRCGRRERRTP